MIDGGVRGNAAAHPALPILSRPSSQDVLGQQRNLAKRNSGRVFDCVKDRRSRAIHRQLANPFRAERPMMTRDLLEQHMNRRKVGAGGHDVVGHLIVGHMPVLPEAFFIECVTNPLSHAALDLPFGEDRVQDLANLLQRPEVRTLREPRRRIDRDLGNIYSPCIRGIRLAAKPDIVPVDIAWLLVTCLRLKLARVSLDTTRRLAETLPAYSRR